MSGIPTLSRNRFDPTMGSVPTSPLLRALWRARHRLRTALGLRGSFRAGGVYFKETSTAPLWRVIAGKSPSNSIDGAKEYRVTYPDGSKQYIRCTAHRVYADAMGPLLLPSFQIAAGMIRPGSRVLCLPGGTGYAPCWLGQHVGRSGAVVSIDPDRESVVFAQHRYPAANIGFERGGVEALRGEIDGAFDVVMSITHIPISPPDDHPLLRELWRVTQPGGWMLIGRSTPGGVELIDRVEHATIAVPAPADLAPGDAHPLPALELLSDADDPIRLVIARKPSSP
ncbi:MAG: class I SAM-dependent methyltransferase [Phycisphaerales bacterium]